MNGIDLVLIGGILFVIFFFYTEINSSLIAMQEINSFCAEKGFEKGQYSPDSEGVYCWNNETYCRTNINECIDKKVNKTFFRDTEYYNEQYKEVMNK